MHVEAPSPRVVRAAGARSGALAVVALACAALISACGSSSSTGSATAKTNLNTARVAESIEESIFSERHIHAKVSCPTGVPQEKGKTFTCIATTSDATKPSAVTKTPFAVTVQNSKGYVTYAGK